MIAAPGGRWDGEREMGLVWLIVGIIVGFAGAMYWLSRKSDERVAEAEARTRQQLREAQDDALQADLAHKETKDRLIALQFEHQQLEARLAELRARLGAAAATRPAQPPAATLPAPAKVAASDDLQVRLKAIDAKIAMLPAGSSARARLMAERLKLVGKPSIAPAPRSVRAPDGAGDDLKRIKGIGPVIEKQLHEMGITSFRQVAALTPEEIARIDAAIEFPGRIEREGWVEQARALARGGSPG
jgi:predicted flap endonuclease-1-like 5' DNA nuclease